MAFAIRIYEKDSYICELIRQRLTHLYPDAYIVIPSSEPYSDISLQLARFSVTLYDQKQFDPDEIDDPKAIPLLNSYGIIDCMSIAAQLGSNSVNPGKCIPIGRTGITEVLIPFVYIAERERFITDYVKEDFSSDDIPVRLDLISRLRAPGEYCSGISGGNMTGLLNAIRSRSFAPDNILNFCNRDNNGFYTPGATSGYDDVYDAGVPACLKLITSARKFVSDGRSSSGALVVIEGFRTDDTIELTKDADKVVILLPGEDSAESLGACEFISGLKRRLDHGSLEVSYLDRLYPAGKDFTYEQAL